MAPAQQVSVLVGAQDAVADLTAAWSGIVVGLVTAAQPGAAAP